MERLEQLTGRNLLGVIEWIERSSSGATSATSTPTTLGRWGFEVPLRLLQQLCERLAADRPLLDAVLE
jgi:hypothetical protein